MKNKKKGGNRVYTVVNTYSYAQTRTALILRELGIDLRAAHIEDETDIFKTTVVRVTHFSSSWFHYHIERIPLHQW